MGKEISCYDYIVNNYGLDQVKSSDNHLKSSKTIGIKHKGAGRPDLSQVSPANNPAGGAARMGLNESSSERPPCREPHVALTGKRKARGGLVGQPMSYQLRQASLRERANECVTREGAKRSGCVSEIIEIIRKEFCDEDEEMGFRGRPCNTPPSNTSNKPLNKTRKHKKEAQCQILNYGVDALNLSTEIDWKKTEFLEYIEEKKSVAKLVHKEVPFNAYDCVGTEHYFLVQERNGRGGRDYVIRNEGYYIELGQKTGTEFPNTIIQIKSAALMQMGHQGASRNIIKLLRDNAGMLKESVVKVSRIDLFCDIDMPGSVWSERKLKDTVVSRSKKLHTYEDRETGMIQTLELGEKGKLYVRIYDKEAEIKEQSGKYYLYDVWGIEQGRTDRKVIRVEFELHREKGKSIGLDRVEDLPGVISSIWAYLTREWIRFTEGNKTRIERSDVTEWWKVVQGAFGEAEPAVRERHEPVSKRTRRDIDRQFLKALPDRIAMEIAAGDWPPDKPITYENAIRHLLWRAEQIGMQDREFKTPLEEKVRERLPKYQYCASEGWYLFPDVKKPVVKAG